MKLQWKKAGEREYMGRVYSHDVLKKLVDDLSCAAKNGRLFGEILPHNEKDVITFREIEDPKPTTISLENVCVKVTDVFFEGENVIVSYEFSDNQTGKAVREYLESQGKGHSLCARMFGTVDEKGNVQNDISVIGFDLDITP